MLNSAVEQIETVLDFVGQVLKVLANDEVSVFPIEVVQGVMTTVRPKLLDNCTTFSIDHCDCIWLLFLDKLPHAHESRQLELSFQNNQVRIVLKHVSMQLLELGVAVKINPVFEGRALPWPRVNICKLIL